MLKRLELTGFKSFADHTVFEFPAGITAVVGPNGSGKSNIVDAVRWVLGEQSAKSLRGGEMADVIFNGSATRRGVGLAEVTLTLDNSRRVLASEDAEIQITRRVYRSGEGEYLINQQVRRLRDIKDLFLGSGAGADAYAVIEQGRVDVLLQASTRERRTIFEEAAGISRFKARKVETQHKLEHVDQNLQRLRDITEEVERQLRSVKLQAAKAQRYQEYDGRLRALRVALGLREFGTLTGQLGEEEQALAGLRDRLAEGAAKAAQAEGQAHQLERELAKLDESVHEHEAVLAQARQQIAAAEATQNHEWSLTADLEADLGATRVRMTELNARVGALTEAVGQAACELRVVQEDAALGQESVRTIEETLFATTTRLREVQAGLQKDKASHLEAMRQAARLQNEAISFKTQVDNLRREGDRLRQRSAQAAESLTSITDAITALAAQESDLQARLQGLKAAQAEVRALAESLRQEAEQTAQTLGDLRARRSGMVSRMEILEGLERSREGLGTGVREVLDLLAQPEPGVWGTVIGLVADLLNVPREYAPLIDLALGDRAQRFVVRDAGLLGKALATLAQPPSGRVSFLPLATGASAVPAEAGLLDHPGVVALPERLATCSVPGLENLPVQLLRHMVIVRDLNTAYELAPNHPHCRFLTLSGELLEPDGTLTVGTHHAEGGILSRKSELRDLSAQVAELDRTVAAVEERHAALRGECAVREARDVALQQEMDGVAEEAALVRTQLGHERQRRADLDEEVALNQREVGELNGEIAGLDEAWRTAQAEAESAEREVQSLHERMEAAEREIGEREALAQEIQERATSAKVELAKTEARLTALRSRHQEMETDLAQRLHERAQGEQHLAGARARLEESQRTMLEASAALAQWYLAKEAAEEKVAGLSHEREALRARRQVHAAEATHVRREWQALQEQAHTHELAAADVRHRRETLVHRLREDYQVDLAELHAGQAPSSQDVASEGVDEAAAANDREMPAIDLAGAQEEIEELRRKLQRLGSVNLDSLQEMADLEARAGGLHTQTEDLVSAKRTLEEIIATINEDSRRLFTDTFNTVRGHFQDLFRKLFGGGMADILLEDESDVLESGIEINARPPGKELRSISLMSGGEKTLTAVALLLAIFRSKPSPFCILDEVDAALDEANIGRYISVLREFLDRSQFIIITHSKRTMAGADILYGITMQESGISKQVAVRFEDWPDEQPAAQGVA